MSRDRKPSLPKRLADAALTDVVRAAVWPIGWFLDRRYERWCERNGLDDE